jgi:osmotically-inducible protein OsmY
LRIAQDVIIAIIYRERVPVGSLDVACLNGVVSLAGTARTQAAVEWCGGVAGRIEGVARVESTMEVVDYSYYPGI